jgi:hypothetical protein
MLRPVARSDSYRHVGLCLPNRTSTVANRANHPLSRDRIATVDPSAHSTSVPSTPPILLALRPKTPQTKNKQSSVRTREQSFFFAPSSGWATCWLCAGYVPAMCWLYVGSVPATRSLRRPPSAIIVAQREIR